MDIENSMCHDITTDYFDFEQNAFKVEQYNSKIIFNENFTIMTKRKYNCFHKLMYKLFFGIKIERIKDGKKTI